ISRTATGQLPFGFVLKRHLNRIPTVCKTLVILKHEKSVPIGPRRSDNSMSKIDIGELIRDIRSIAENEFPPLRLRTVRKLHRVEGLICFNPIHQDHKEMALETEPWNPGRPYAVPLELHNLDIFEDACQYPHTFLLK